MRDLRTTLSLLLAILGSLLAGCVGGVEPGSSASGLVEITPETEPLASVPTEVWVAAPAGCEDLLAAAVTFRLASAADGLVAAMDAAGRVVCVDTVDAVQEELQEEGDDARADQLGAQFLLAAGLAGFPSPEMLVAGDPTPQPNVGASAPSMAGAANGDPTPQPNTNPR